MLQNTDTGTDTDTDTDMHTDTHGQTSIVIIIDYFEILLCNTTYNYITLKNRNKTLLTS